MCPSTSYSYINFRLSSSLSEINEQMDKWSMLQLGLTSQNQGNFEITVVKLRKTDVSYPLCFLHISLTRIDSHLLGLKIHYVESSKIADI